MNKNEIKSNKTKKKICDTYIEIYKQKEINQITIKEITDKAGYNRSTFYIYYKDIYDLHDQIKASIIHKAKKEAQKLNNQVFSFKELFKVIMNFYIKNEKYLTTLIAKDNTLAERIKKELKPVMTNLLKKELNKPEYDYLIEYHINAVFGLINFWINNNKNITIDELFRLLYKISTKGVITVIEES